MKRGMAHVGPATVQLPVCGCALDAAPASFGDVKEDIVRTQTGMRAAIRMRFDAAPVLHAKMFASRRCGRSELRKIQWMHHVTSERRATMFAIGCDFHRWGHIDALADRSFCQLHQIDVAAQ
eukprot:scaffold287245_cov30-Tisochrysis_lutea.AAC.2